MQETNDLVESQKPSVDFFKDIFLDGSDDEILIAPKPFKSEGLQEKERTYDDEKEIRSNEIVSEKKESTEPKPSSTTHLNLFPPKGIFANLNFDDLFKPNKSTANETEKKIGDNKNKINNLPKSYGPFLPEYEKLTTTYVKIKGIDKTFEEDEWVEKSEVYSSESSHKNKHSKHSKHKKHKKSKKKSHKSK